MTYSRLLAPVVMVSIAVSSVLAQDSSLSRGASPIASLYTIGSGAEDHARLEQLAGRASTAGWLIRTPSTLTPRLGTEPGRRQLACRIRAELIEPQVDMTWNSAIPYERNDGGVWSGRGATIHALGGGRAACGRIRVQIAPEIWYAQNRAFSLIGITLPGRSGYINPFFSGTGWSADLPVRFGDQPLLVLEPGQSMIEVDVWRVTVGLGSEAQWWGPAIRNALLMSNHAAGIPGAYLRPTRPVSTPLGQLDARWIVGVLMESPFFDFEPLNDDRSLAGMVGALRTRADSNLTLGAGIIVYALLGNTVSLPSRALDPITRFDEGSNSAPPGTSTVDQLFSLFARWIFPASGVETYVEWARTVPPKSLRSLLVAPQYSQGYTLGFQWLSNVETISDAWRVQAEVTDLEQSYQSRAVNPPTFYVSANVPQGYTQRGQVVGAMLGPGSSSQWLAVDRLRRGARLGVFLSRVRWQNDAFFRAPTGLSAWAHDVSLVAGARAARNVGRVSISAELAAERRLNYLFQSATIGFDEDATFDVRNLAFRIALEPRVRD